MREHWRACELTGPDEPAAAVLDPFPAPGRPARLRERPGDHRPGEHRPGEQGPGEQGPGEQGPGEQGLRWPPAESWWPGPTGGDSTARERPDRLDWLFDDLDKLPAAAQDPPISRRYDPRSGVASEAAGRFAAEW